MDTLWRILVNNLSVTGFNPVQSIVKFLMTDSDNTPFVIRLKDLGDNVVTLTEIVVTASGVVGAVAGAASSVFSPLSAIPIVGTVIRGGVKVVSDTAGIWISYISIICELALGFFAMLALYIPLIPFIAFMGQVLVLLLSVVEGVAAAPFLAFAQFDTYGEGLASRTHHGYTFMLRSFMGPVTLKLNFLIDLN